MSAKDRRKSMTLRLPAPLLPVLRAERRAGRDAGAAAALRRLVERHLHRLACLPPLPEGPPAGRAYRLQLSAPVRRAILAAAMAQGESPERLVLRLLTAAGDDHPHGRATQ